MEGLRIACLYSLNCPELLKEPGAQKIVFEFIKNPEKEKTPLVKEILEKLEPFIFYQLIALQNGITDPFEENVVRAYWLGNNLLKTITKRDARNFFNLGFSFEHHKLTLIKILDLVGGKPHHNWETLWLIKKVKRKLGLPREFLVNLDNCLITAGEIVYAGGDTLQVKTKELSLERGKIVLRNAMPLIGRGLDKVKERDFVSIHLLQAREKISRNCAKNLIEITKEAIEFFKE